MKLKLAISIAFVILLSACQKEPEAAAELDSAAKTEPVYVRSEASKARDVYRHPQETLAFFEVTASSTVVEIWPGGGWYTQVLAPMLKDQGQLIAAHFPAESHVEFFRKSHQKYLENYIKKPELFGYIQLTELAPPEQTEIALEGAADHVLTFRNVHNWMRNDQVPTVFAAAFKALKPGGIFGVVEHKAPAGFSFEEMVKSGYVTEDYVKEMAKNAGFEYVSQSSINTNPKDTHNHPYGVWSLPPTLRGGEEDKETYLAIGESDRMTLKFRKPE